VNTKPTKFEYAGLDRPQHLRVTHFEYTTASGRTKPALLVEANSVVVLQTGWEERYTFQTTSTQGDGNYVSVVETQPDSPPEVQVVSFSREEQPSLSTEERFWEEELRATGDQELVCSSRQEWSWEQGLRAVVSQLVKNRVAQTTTWKQEQKRVVAESSERLIAELVYKALLRQSGCDVE
jgi:hypothetical protein